MLPANLVRPIATKVVQEITRAYLVLLDTACVRCVPLVPIKAWLVSHPACRAGSKQVHQHWVLTILKTVQVGKRCKQVLNIVLKT